MTASIALWLCLGIAVEQSPSEKAAPGPPASASAPENADAPGSDSLTPGRDWKQLGRALWFDPGTKRAVVQARVVLREGPLEHLLCLKGTKEHEAILATPADPRTIHAALLLTGAEPGHPVVFVPKFVPPAGPSMAIELLWRQNGGLHRSDARRWIWDEKAKKPLAIDWVFAGSLIYEDRVTRRPVYGANEGDLITVANFATAILDLPIDSSASDADRSFVAHTESVPPIGTEVFMVISPRPAGPRSDTGPKAKPAAPSDERQDGPPGPKRPPNSDAPASSAETPR